MYQILYISKNGKAGLFVSKLMASCFLCVIIAGYFTFGVFFCIWIKKGISFECLNIPIQTMSEFYWCPFSLTVLEYLFLVFGMKILVGVLLLSFVFLYSTFIKRGIGVMMASIVTTLLIFVAPTLSDKYIFLFKKIGLSKLLNGTEYIAEYNSLNIFGEPIQILYIGIVFTVALSIFIICLSYILFCRQCIKEKSTK